MTDERDPHGLPLLPTTVVGSYPVPEWMERLKTDYFRGRMSAAQLEDVHEMAIKAALRDQEVAGIDIVSDGELRRDNDIDYFVARIPGVTLESSVKDFYFDYYHASVDRPIDPPDRSVLGLADDYAFTSVQTAKPIKFSFTGPFSLAARLHDEVYRDRRKLALALAATLREEACELVRRGATLLQVDEPFLAGRPEEIDTAVEALNVVTHGVDATWALHVCYGNRYARPLWEGHYDFLFPGVLDSGVDQLVLEFARKGHEDLPVLGRFGWTGDVGLGVIDVKSRVVESPELVASRIRNALRLVEPERLSINPDCGLRNLSPDVAFAKLGAMVRGTAIVRAELAAAGPCPVASGPDPARAPTPLLHRGA